MEKFSLRDGNLEVRSAGNYLLQGEKHNRAEIVKWFDESGNCFVVAFWTMDKEGFYLKFVGNRPFNESIDSKIFMDLAKMGQTKLDLYFDSLTK